MGQDFEYAMVDFVCRCDRHDSIDLQTGTSGTISTENFLHTKHDFPGNLTRLSDRCESETLLYSRCEDVSGEIRRWSVLLVLAEISFWIMYHVTLALHDATLRAPFLPSTNPPI